MPSDREFERNIAYIKNIDGSIFYLFFSNSIFFLRWNLGKYGDRNATSLEKYFYQLGQKPRFQFRAKSDVITAIHVSYILDLQSKNLNQKWINIWCDLNKAIVEKN
jgi:hypothetical protein